MKITIIGYKNHASRLKSILNKLGYDNVVNYNYHTDSLDRDIRGSMYDPEVYFISPYHLPAVTPIEGSEPNTGFEPGDRYFKFPSEKVAVDLIKVFQVAKLLVGVSVA